MKTFGEFIDKKGRAAKKELGIIKKTLEKDGMTVEDFLEDEDPYIYIRSAGGLSFDGIRVYKIGNNIAYRVQKEDKTHPYGVAYPLDMEDMFNDLISDNIGEEKAGREVMESIANEIKKFFQKSADAEKEIRASEFDKQKDPMGRAMQRSASVRSSTGTDYANLIYNKARV